MTLRELIDRIPQSNLDCQIKIVDNGNIFNSVLDKVFVSEITDTTIYLEVK